MTTATINEWNEALIATKARMDEKAIEEAQIKARASIRKDAAARRAVHEEAMKAISARMKQDIAASGARIAAEFAAARRAQADRKVLALAIGAHDKEARGGAR